MKLLFFDVETTGLDPKVHGIHQLAGEIVINDKVVDKFEFRINPFKGCEMDSDALAVSNTNCLDFLKYHKEFQVSVMLSGVLNKHLDCRSKKDKFFLAGWRAPEFDGKFLQAFVDRSPLLYGNFNSYFWDNPIDVKTLATQYLMERRPEMESFSLAPVAKYLGIEVDESKLHSAVYDAYLCRTVYEVLPKCTLGEHYYSLHQKKLSKWCGSK
jgi:DNA polymerase-3 subunit epsilon